MPQPQISPTSALLAERLQLELPSSVGVFERYAEAQRAVDHLADHEFPVEQCMIVGTDLRQVERVTGRLTQTKVALGGMASGLWMGLFVGILFMMLDGQGPRAIVTPLLVGALFGLVWALIGYSLTRGRRDFTSVTQVVATRYEVLVERQLQQQARTMLREAGLMGDPTLGAVPGDQAAAPAPQAPAPVAPQSRQTLPGQQAPQPPQQVDSTMGMPVHRSRAQQAPTEQLPVQQAPTQQVPALPVDPDRSDEVDWIDEQGDATRR
ncbi:general stress protein [Arsenicicoccus dermatophilus]|uniref:general stress protein n=1 Tax=Arsenicicoccus dermatophilus TaxID=1076331 RepID=UPI003917304A